MRVGSPSVPMAHSCGSNQLAEGHRIRAVTLGAITATVQLCLMRHDANNRVVIEHLREVDRRLSARLVRSK